MCAQTAKPVSRRARAIVLTREIAWAASTDAGNRAMRHGGRTAWSREDYNAAVAEFDRLWPLHRDGFADRCRCPECAP